MSEDFDGESTDKVSVMVRVGYVSMILGTSKMSWSADIVRVAEVSHRGFGSVMVKLFVCEAEETIE